MRRHRYSQYEYRQGDLSDHRYDPYNDYGRRTRMTSSSRDYYHDSQDSRRHWADRLNEYVGRDNRDRYSRRDAEDRRGYRGGGHDSYTPREGSNHDTHSRSRNIRTRRGYSDDYNRTCESSWDSRRRGAYDDQPQRRPRDNSNREQRRSYHSSTRATPTRSPYDANRNSGAAVSTSSIASRFFQHSDNPIIQVDTTRSRRINEDVRRSSSPNPSFQHTEENMAPTEEYLQISLHRSETQDKSVDVKGTVRKLLVLDLNGTLVYRSPHRRRDRNHSRWGGAPADTEEDVYAQFDPSKPRPLRPVHPRPYLNSFRDYLFHPNTKLWLDTMVWSSAQPHSVRDMVETCFGDKKSDLVAIWARDRLGLNPLDYGKKVQTTKDLNKPWNELNTPKSPLDSPEHPVPQRNHSAKSTLLLDDSPLKAHLQPYNHLCLKEYDVGMRKHDLAVRELEVARERFTEAHEGKPIIDGAPEDSKADEYVGPGHDVDTVNSNAHDEDVTIEENATEDGSARKRKRKEKKENKKKERIEETFTKLTEDGEHAEGGYDEMLLAVVGILDAVKFETNVAAWVRSGGIIQTLSSGSDCYRETSVESTERTKKRARVSGEVGKNSDLSPTDENNTASSTSNDPPPPSSSLPLENSKDEQVVESETERTGVPLNGVKTISGEVEGVKEQLWFNRPGASSYWASRGRRVLQDLEIDVVAGIKGPTG